VELLTTRWKITFIFHFT